MKNVVSRLSTKRIKNVFAKYSGVITSLTLLADDQLLASSTDGNLDIKLWDLRNLNINSPQTVHIYKPSSKYHHHSNNELNIISINSTISTISY